MAKTPIRYWDANCFLGWFKKEPDKQKVCEGVLVEAQKGKLNIVTSAITLIEVIKLKGQPPLPAADEETIKNFFENDFIIIQNVDRLMGELGRELIWKHGLNPKDAIHIATALHHGLSVFDTFDDELMKLDGKLGNPIRLRIGKPDIPLEEQTSFISDEETTKA